MDGVAARDCAIRRRMAGIPQTDNVDSVYGNIMFFNKIAHNGVGKMLGCLNPGLPFAGGKSLNFDQVALLTSQICCYSVESVFCFRVEHCLPGAEANFSLAYGLILIEIGNRRSELLRPHSRLLGRLLSLGGHATGARRLLARAVRRALRLMNSSLRSCVYILDIARIAGAQLIKLVQSVFDRIQLPIDPLLASKWVKMSPKPFVGLNR